MIRENNWSAVTISLRMMTIEMDRTKESATVLFTMIVNTSLLLEPIISWRNWIAKWWVIFDPLLATIKCIPLPFHYRIGLLSLQGFEIVFMVKVLAATPIRIVRFLFSLFYFYSPESEIGMYVCNTRNSWVVIPFTLKRLNILECCVFHIPPFSLATPFNITTICMYSIQSEYIWSRRD